MYFKDKRSEEAYDRTYRKIEAMYRKGLSIDEICREMHHMQRWQTIDIIQRIFAGDEMRKERKRREMRAEAY